jgi:hydroxyacylglutathione hydrolase
MTAPTTIIQFVADSLGDASYLVVSGTQAAMIDPQRDIRPYLESAKSHGATITYVLETHVHNDYVSGGRELAQLGAAIVAPAGSNLEFPHTPVSDGDEIAIGDAVLRAVAAPGHTYEHTAYLAVEANGDIRGAFTGGAILMAAAGRSDLLGPDHSEELTKLQWETAHRLSEMLPPSAEILPTHGAGSFCSTSGANVGRRGPLAEELSRNPVLNSPTYEVFRELHLSGAAPIPGYYKHMGPMNKRGPKVYGAPPTPALLQVDEFVRLAEDGVTVLDVRKRQDYGRGHVPFAYEMEESNSLLAYAGWLVPFNAPLALVTYDATQAERVTADFFRIGYEDVRGHLPHDAWVSAERELSTLPAMSRDEVAKVLIGESMPVLDVRFAYEQANTPLTGAVPAPVDRLHEWADKVGKGPVGVVCASGQRAAMAASFLRARGVDARALVEGGADDVQKILEPAGSMAGSS